MLDKYIHSISILLVPYTYRYGHLQWALSNLALKLDRLRLEKAPPPPKLQATYTYSLGVDYVSQHS